MPWIIAVIAGLALGAMLVGSREARLALVAAAALLIVVAGWFILSDNMRERRALTMIGLEEVELRDMSVEKRRGLHYVLASVKNLSAEYDVQRLQVRVFAHDCPGEILDETCDIVGEASISVNLKIPAGQVRRLEELIDFTDLPDVTELLWSYEISEVRAETG